MNLNYIKSTYLSEVDSWITERKLYGEKDCLEGAWVRFSNQINLSESFQDKILYYFSNKQLDELNTITKLEVHIKEQVRVHKLFMQSEEDPYGCPKMLFSFDTMDGWTYSSLQKALERYKTNNFNEPLDINYKKSLNELQKRVIAYRWLCCTIWS